MPRVYMSCAEAECAAGAGAWASAGNASADKIAATSARWIDMEESRQGGGRRAGILARQLSAS